ncbi:hypothetical protein F4Y59_02395 [Candidatus Poribacteria bacterium]|nr:hypothetical protein [Candidatus Poribacteria bacterium]MXY26995.1 hypothetical protein [Candidatus Poribacteria bacterium]MYK18384.1 hypothetical protein [Candidatus Poribacteria bacterium]
MSVNLKTIKEELLDPIDRDLREIADAIVTSDGTCSDYLESQIQQLDELLDRYNAAVALLKDVSKQNNIEAISVR